jgi:hypothetical protein
MDETDLDAVVAPLIDAALQRGLASLGPRERVVYLVWCFAGEVNNGGLAQFFFNSSGEYATETVDALRQVGCSVSARLLERAIALFPNGVPKDIEERNAAMGSTPETVGATWKALDDDYFTADSNQIYARLCRYWEGGAA